jgi:hypothetical protein
MRKNEAGLISLVLTCCLAFIALALLRYGPQESLRGFIRLQTSAARLIIDFTLIGGPGGALLNSALMGLLALGLVRLSGVSLSGPTIAGIFTIMGFSLFGKTAANCAPIVLGVFLASKAAGKPFRSYLLMGLFGTALGPLVAFIAFESGLPLHFSIPLAVLAGAIAGFILPALAIAMLRLHEGFNIYNIGFTCGFFGLFAAAIFAAARLDLSMDMVWSIDPDPGLALICPLVSLLFLAWGIALDRKELSKNLKRIFKLSGRLPSDFMESASPGAALVNAGLLGLAASLYLLAIGAAFNGPVIGGVLTLIGFGTFGKHARNCWSVALGVIGSTLLFGKSLTDPGPVLALLFGSTLAPLAGEFGPFVGFAAGFVHLLVVDRSAAWHGGLDLYNNGFSGGLTASLFVALIQWGKSIGKSN